MDERGAAGRWFKKIKPAHAKGRTFDTCRIQICAPEGTSFHYSHMQEVAGKHVNHSANVPVKLWVVLGGMLLGFGHHLVRLLLSNTNVVFRLVTVSRRIN